MKSNNIVKEPEYLIFDDFYKDPEGVRALALQAEYAGKGALSANAPGIESKLPFFSDAVINKIEAIIEKKIKVDPQHNAFGRFRLAVENDKRRTKVHTDNTDWTAVVYLSEEQHCKGGTSFYRHKETNLISPPDQHQLRKMGLTKKEFDRDIVLRDSVLADCWELTKMCPMKFNRCVILRGAQYFHGSDQLFGKSFADGRLTQNFFFNELSR
jgi:hypothetical protein